MILEFEWYPCLVHSDPSIRPLAREVREVRWRLSPSGESRLIFLP
jgi:hypothetical protein